MADQPTTRATCEFKSAFPAMMEKVLHQPATDRGFPIAFRDILPHMLS